MGNLKMRPLYYLYLLPAFVLFLIFFIVPFVQTFYFSLQDWDSIGEMTFEGIANYVEMFQDEVFIASVGRVLKYALIQVVVQITLGLLFSALLRGEKKGNGFFRAVYFLPYIISSAAICVMFTVMYDNDIGLINNLLRAAGLDGLVHIWLGEEATAFYATIAVPIWQGLGMYIVVLLSGLQGISEEYYDAAKIDGANALQRFRSITLPLLWPIIQICIVLSVSGALKNFDYVYMLTGGGPGSSTHVPATFMYDKTFVGMRYGYGSAVAVFIFAMGFLFTVVFKGIAGRKSVDE